MARKIILIDDTQVLAQSIADILYMEGYDVHLFNSAIEVLPELERLNADLIITDMLMPHMNGLDFVRHLREQEPPVSTPVVMLTADTNPENEMKARAAGANRLLYKPFDYEELITAIKSFLYE